ncbi:MAG: four helix bundle protein [Betaproteobacteria bacterium RIFCSPLOWO2_12_FULL_62_58]|nr:MAG: four helix bundle protein [Betaproteobacteria bacterium RIFCSPLOWO2_12_FULL_62_58]
MNDERKARSGPPAQDLVKRTKRFALSIIELYSRLPTTTVAQVLGRQLLRSGTSVGAQYREARRAKSDADFISKIEGALQELEETAYWLDLLEDSRVIAADGAETLRAEVHELTSILVASVRTVKRRK